jgi:hypothetical protein
MKNAFDLVRDIEPAQLLTPTQESTFGETVGASLSFKYSPVIDFFRGGSEFGFAPLPEENYVARQHIPEDLKQYGTSLLRATSQKHMDFLSTSLRNSLETRETLAKSGVVAQFGAEVFDPVNWVALPFSASKTLAGAAIRGGLSTTAVVAGQEAIRYPLDPLATPEEVGFTLGSSFVLGGALNGLATISARRRIAAQESGTVEINKLSEAIGPIDGEEIDPNIAQSIFTDSWIYKSVTTPMKRMLTDPEIPNSVKLRTLRIANDSGILLAANKKGQKIGNSVFQNAKLHEGEWVGVYDDLMELWGQSTGDGTFSPIDYTYNRAEFEDWITAVDAKVMRREEPASNFEAQAMERLNTFYANWEVRLRDEGMIGSQSHYEKVVVDRERRLQTAQKKMETARNTEYRARLEAQVNRYSNEIDEARQTIDDLKGQGPITPPNEEVFRPRYWDRDAITANRESFAKVLNDWFTANPSTYVRNSTSGKYERVDLSTNPESISKRVDDMIDNLLGESDPLNPDVAYYGMGKSKHSKHRVLDIPNELVLDYMVRNPINIMKAYVQRTGSRYEFSKTFGGASIDDILDDTFIEMMEAGSTPEKAYAAMKDMRHLYDRVAGSVVKSPDSLDQKAGRVMRDLAQLNYLGSAGLSTVTEPARIIMEHGLGKSFRGLFSILSDGQLKMGAGELRKSGEALERLNGSAHLRLVDDLNNNPLRASFMDKAKDAFYTLNGLGPITRILKDFDGMMRSHTLIDYSVRLTQGKATKMEQEYLARYNVDANDAQRIANAPWQKSKAGFYMANTDAWTNTIEFPSTTAEVISGPTESYAASGRYKPAFYRESENTIFIDEEYIKDVMWHERGWENPRVEGVNPIEKGIINSPDDYVTFIKMHEIMHTVHSSKSLGFDKRTKVGKADYENAINDLATAEIKKQARVDPETVKTFRNALGSGVMNTILMGTPADKPIITDGIVYIPMRVASQFGMKEDAAYKGYARVENGLLGLPFQFYSYALAAVNKTTAAYGHGQLKSQYVGTAISMGLGYMLLQAKTPDYIEMSFQDQFARSFDYSGVAALYSDMFYTAMGTSLALGGPNLTGGLLKERFPQEPNLTDAATGVLGAGPSITSDLARGMYELTTGNIGKGSKEVIRNLPFARLWFLKGKVNEMTRMLETEFEEPSGFGRY